MTAKRKRTTTPTAPAPVQTEAEATAPAPVQTGGDANAALRDLYADIEDTFAHAMLDLGAERDAVKDAMKAMRADAAAAMAAGDLKHIQALAAELPAILTKAGVSVRVTNRERVTLAMSRMLAGLFQLASKLIAPLLVCVLLLGSGCAYMRKQTVPAKGIAPLVGELCAVADQCAGKGYIPAQAACSAADGSLTTRLDSQKVMQAAPLARDLTTLCGSIDVCLDSWQDLQPYRRSSYVRWCDTLQETAALALSE